MMKRILSIFVSCVLLAHAEKPLFDMEAIRDASTLDVEVLQDWHEVGGEVPTRQKLMSIRVGELWPGQDLRAPVRLVVPADEKAMGFHLTGGNQTKRLQQDTRPRGVDAELLKGGVGLVQTVVQTLKSQGQPELDRAMSERFIRTLNPHFSIQYWGWPATLMRAVTAATAETEYFEPGKIAVSGGSKNGASPSVSLIHDERLTAQFGTVSPLWESPLRLCDREAWDELDEFNKEEGERKPHAFLGGTYGPIYNRDALAAGHSWKDLQELAERLADDIFISRNFQALEKRGVDMLFEPGTHDFVCYDIAWGGAHYPQIPVYYIPNSGHGQKRGHPGAEKGVRNRDALLLSHFFHPPSPRLRRTRASEKMLPPPAIKTRVEKGTLFVAVKFPEGSVAESGRIFWMFDRAPDGSAAALREKFSSNDWKTMTFDKKAGAWTAEIELQPGASHIDIFSSHVKTLQIQSAPYKTCISSPYTRIQLLHR